tara:strand:- start:427 stop:657 length:231 start_codon:yes stop_codon:yes gene_type:complete
MSNTKTLNEIINQPIQGSVKKLKDTPEYTTLQEAKTDLRLDEVVRMVHTINGRLIEIAEKLGIEEDGSKRYQLKKD